MRLGIIGTGRVGASFVLALRQAEGIASVGIIASSPAKSTTLAKTYGVTAYADGAALVKDCDVVLLTVQDDHIGDVSQSLAQHIDKGMPCVVLHCSGAMDLSPLYPLQEKGMSIGSLHPLQSFAVPDGAQLRHIFFAIDGDAKAQAAARQLVQLLDGTAFAVPASERPMYHAAACFASNYAVAVMALAQSLMSRWTATPEDAGKALWPLIAGTIHNVSHRPLMRTALTGPIASGDVGTIEKHVATLPAAYQDVYRSLGAATAGLAKDNGTISREQYTALLSVLRNEKEISHE